MSIYPDRRITGRRAADDGTETWIEEEHTPGLIRHRVVTAEKWTETRTDCFCCSCPEYGNADPHCRNHGYAGIRACQTHGMNGGPDDEGVTPKSVQEHRKECAS